MPTTALSVVNAALARIGTGPLTALDEDSDLASQVAAIYQDTVDFLLSDYDWSFARRTVELARLAETPLTGWAYAYAMPADVLRGPVRLLTNPRDAASVTRVWLKQDGRIYADQVALWGAFSFRVDPDIWPAYFRTFCTVAIAAALAVPVTHDANLKDMLDREAYGPASRDGRGGLYERAAMIDVREGGPNDPMGDDAVLAAPYRGSGGW